MSGQYGASGLVNNLTKLYGYYIIFMPMSKLQRKNKSIWINACGTIVQTWKQCKLIVTCFALKTKYLSNRLSQALSLSAFFFEPLGGVFKGTIQSLFYFYFLLNSTSSLLILYFFYTIYCTKLGLLFGDRTLPIPHHQIGK